MIFALSIVTLVFQKSQICRRWIVHLMEIGLQAYTQYVQVRMRPCLINIFKLYFYTLIACVYGGDRTGRYNCILSLTVVSSNHRRHYNPSHYSCINGQWELVFSDNLSGFPPSILQIFHAWYELEGVKIGHSISKPRLERQKYMVALGLYIQATSSASKVYDRLRIIYPNHV